MDSRGIGKLFKNGRSQAVRLPREFRFAGDRVRIRRLGSGVLLEPMVLDVKLWFAELDADIDGPLVVDRCQPQAPHEEIL